MLDVQLKALQLLLASPIAWDYYVNLSVSKENRTEEVVGAAEFVRSGTRSINKRVLIFFRSFVVGFWRHI